MTMMIMMGNAHWAREQLRLQYLQLGLIRHDDDDDNDNYKDDDDTYGDDDTK